jgi:L-threonylcarbamoyladenylate synthase
VTETDIDLTEAVAAIRRGDLVVYPTETVYGLAADALDAEAVERVFEAKGRPRDKPISMALPDAEVARDYTHISDREDSFCARFLPGPVTVLLERTDRVPDKLVAGRDRVGIRVPDHDLSRKLARRTGPITSTSANKSGRPSARRIEDIDPELRERAAVVLDTGKTPGTESTVVNVAEDEIVRRGARADEIENWLAEN